MKSIIKLKDGWFIRKISPVDRLDEKMIAECEGSSEEELPAQMPAQVHEILLWHGKIEDPTVMGNPEKCFWVAETDWIYKCTFNLNIASLAEPSKKKKYYLNFRGLDTLTDIYLNGRHIASHKDMYIPLRVEITENIKEENILLVHFHSPHEYLKHHTSPAVESGKVPKHKLLRKVIHDFVDFLGPKPYLTNIGIFDDVLLEVADEAEIEYADIQAKVNEDYSKGILQIAVNGIGHLANGILKITAIGPDGGVCGESNSEIGLSPWYKEAELVINRPALWWPRSHGNHPLYKVIIELYDGNVPLDKVEKTVGFRKIEMDSPFDFRINGKPVKLWGANLAPIQRITNAWNSEVALKLLDMAENAHMNILRVWGEGVPYPDELYDEADKRGFLLWQEFYMSYGMHPDDDEYRELCCKEAEHVIRRLKHHPSILMWCGGNESIMSTEYDFAGEKCLGQEIFMEDFKKICEKLDPDRYYHEISPYGGSFANDPGAGDSHGYTHIWFVPGAEYPVMLSENTRISVPALKSLKRYLGDKPLWPEDFTGKVKNHNDPPMPQTWLERAPGGVWPRTKNYERFYDADNPEDLIYKLGSAHSHHLRETVERCRRGRPWYDDTGERICKGHLIWKLNEPYPAFYSSMIDYYLEPNMAYYALRRAYTPVLLSFDIGNFIHLWLVNDSTDKVEGTVVCCLFNPRTNRIMKEIKKDVSVEADESMIVCRLDEFGQFKRENFLFAKLADKNGNIIARTNDYVDNERYLYFPDAKLQLELDNGDIIITTDQFARCIELAGDNNGDEFGWFFEDNYFDLMPWETKRVKVLGRHNEGVITAKARYSSQVARLQYKR